MVQWNKLKVVIFDVDGTLYNQSKLRKKMVFSLASHYLFRPWRYKDLLILYHFRAQRERRAGHKGPDLENRQYQWCAEKIAMPDTRIREVVKNWIFTYPNRFLKGCVFPGVYSLFNTLRESGIKIVIYSDYQAVEKMTSMALQADLILCSTDKEIDRFKPDPAALNYLMEKFNARPEECLFIGDREELDGKCASNAGIPYLIVNRRKNPSQFYKQIGHNIANLKPIEI